jgi:predicted ATPase
MSTTAFLFTDIQGSSSLWERHEDAMRVALAAHDRTLDEAVDAHGGRVFSRMGDGIAAAFDSVTAAIDAALQAQRDFLATDHPEVGALRVRMGIHIGEVEERDNDFFGPVLNRTARIMAAGHGGQVLVSGTAARLAGGEHRLTDLGEHRLRDLGSPERIHQLVGEGLPETFPALRTLSESPNNLPAQLTSFIGRDDELDRLVALLDTNRPVTVTGVGGVGKTRAALQASADLAPAFPGGVWLVELAPVAEPEGVGAAFMTALGLSETDGGTALDAVLEHVAPLSALLLVDNCEHLIDASAEAVEALLGRAPGVRVIATSRELLGVPGEAALGLRSMSMGADGSGDALDLLTERASTAKRGFSPVGHEAALAEICRRLDGIPLALELAAARLRTFSPERVAGLLDESFRLLTGGSRTAVPRQRTLEATIEWSHRLLEPDEQALFRALSVFSGGFMVDAVAAICLDGGDEFEAMDLLAGLADKSLVSSDDHEDRFRLLETIRQYAAARLEEHGEADALRRRHAEYHRRLVLELSEAVLQSEPMDLIARIRLEPDNLRAAMTWALEQHEGDLALDLAEGFGRFVGGGGWSEEVEWYERALLAAGPSADPVARAHRLRIHGGLLSRGPDQAGALERLDEAIAIYEELDTDDVAHEVLSEYATAVTNATVIRFYLGEGGARNEHFRAGIERSLEIARRADDKVMIAHCLRNLAHHVDPESDPDEVRAVFVEAEEANRELGHPLALARLEWMRARYELFVGEPDRSIEHWKDALAIAEGLATEQDLSWYEFGLHLAELARGDVGAAADMRTAIERIVAVHESLTGEHAMTQMLLLGGAMADLADGLLDRVARAVGASHGEAERRSPVPWDLAPLQQQVEAECRERLDADRFASAVAEGTAWDRKEIAEFLADRG